MGIKFVLGNTGFTSFDATLSSHIINTVFGATCKPKVMFSIILSHEAKGSTYAGYNR